MRGRPISKAQAPPTPFSHIFSDDSKRSLSLALGESTPESRWNVHRNIGLGLSERKLKKAPLFITIEEAISQPPEENIFGGGLHKDAPQKG